MATKSISVNNQCEHNSLIKRQFVKIEALETEISLLRIERDHLLGENERLHFQLQCLIETKDNKNKDGATAQEFQENNRQSNYELSQSIIDKRVDALERKYGGIRARESATIIQRAFRTYKLQKRFKTIAFEALKQTTNQRAEEETRSTRSDDSQHSNHVFIPESLLSSVTCSQQFESQRKRLYRVGLNLFNKHPPERGVNYLLKNGFIESHENLEKQCETIARFLLTRKGISKAMIGEYISTNHNFNQKVLKFFAQEMEFSQMTIDVALRKFQTFFRFPGEAQKIERLVDTFATQYIECNPNERLSRDSVFILSFAIIMLNTDLHSPTNTRNRMTSQQWLNNLNGVFKDNQFCEDFLKDIYFRIKSQEFRTGADHVTQVSKVQSAIVAQNRHQMAPNLCLESRRLVCYCRLYEIRDQNKKDSKDRHQREVFLFNDLLLVTKLSARAKNQMPEYVFRQSLPLEGLSVQLFENLFYRFGIEIKRKLDDRCLLCFNARNQLDQQRFAEDLKESILETDEMENIRITKTNSLLALQQSGQGQDGQSQGQSQNRRKSSSGSLDSGLSLPSRDHSPQTSNSAPKMSQ